MTNYVPLPSHATLDERATEINRLFQIALTANGKLHRTRWQIGQELLAAQGLVAEGEWLVWCKKLPFSVREAQKMMSMGGKPDPIKANEEEREYYRNRDAKVRSIAKDALSTTHDTILQQDDEEETEDNVTYITTKSDVGQILSQMSRMGREDLTRIRDHADALLEGKRNVA